MARPLRLEVPGGIFHVTARGNARGRTYRCDADRFEFLDLFAGVQRRYGWRCLSYCLMGNHFHLVVETPKPNLSIGMRHLNGVYAKRFNRRHNRTGHVLQGRFGAVLVERDAHMLEVVRYVARNPVKARLCVSPRDWDWSSHRAILGLTRPGLVAVEDVLAHFDCSLARARDRYADFVELSEGADLSANKEVVFGSDAFRKQHLETAQLSIENPKQQWLARRPPLDELLKLPDRSEAVALAHIEHGYSLSSIARELGCHYSTVSRALKAAELQGNARCKT